MGVNVHNYYSYTVEFRIGMYKSFEEAQKFLDQIIKVFSIKVHSGYVIEQWAHTDNERFWEIRISTKDIEIVRELNTFLKEHLLFKKEEPI